MKRRCLNQEKQKSLLTSANSLHLLKILNGKKLSSISLSVEKVHQMYRFYCWKKLLICSRKKLTLQSKFFLNFIFFIHFANTTDQFPVKYRFKILIFYLCCNMGGHVISEGISQLITSSEQTRYFCSSRFKPA